MKKTWGSCFDAGSLIMRLIVLATHLPGSAATAKPAIKIAWRDWGKQVRVLPQPNLF